MIGFIHEAFNFLMADFEKSEKLSTFQDVACDLICERKPSRYVKCLFMEGWLSLRKLA